MICMLYNLYVCIVVVNFDDDYCLLFVIIMGPECKSVNSLFFIGYLQSRGHR